DQLGEAPADRLQRLALLAADRLRQCLGAILDARIGAELAERLGRRHLGDARARGEEQRQLVVARALERPEPIAQERQLARDAEARGRVQLVAERRADDQRRAGGLAGVALARGVQLVAGAAERARDL